MNKAILYTSLLIALFSVSCHKEQVNQSKLVYEKGNAFKILSINQGIDNQILCVGNNHGEKDSIVIRRYSRDLKLLETMYPSRIPEFGKNLDVWSSFQCVSMVDGRWLIGGFDGNSRLTVFITDNKLNVLKKRTITATKSSYHELKPLSNGGFL
jgi:hypothetical protein